jgi:alcohol dehydrogenase (nicotinoprotein)
MEFGATHYIDASKQDVVAEVMKITGIGVDYAFDAIGKGEVQSQCVEACHKNGKSVWVGVAPINQKTVALNTWIMTLYQKHISGTCYGGASPFEMVPQLNRMYKAGHIKFDQLITKYYKLDQINEAYADMLAGKNICGCIRMD